MLQEHVQGFRQPTELSNLLPLEEICELDRVTNRPYFIVNKISREIRSIKECPAFTARERQGMILRAWILCTNVCNRRQSTMRTWISLHLKLQLLIYGQFFLITRSTSFSFLFLHFFLVHYMKCTIQIIISSTKNFNCSEIGLQKVVDDLSMSIGSSERIVQTPGKNRDRRPYIPSFLYPLICAFFVHALHAHAKDALKRCFLLL